MQFLSLGEITESVTETITDIGTSPSGRDLRRTDSLLKYREATDPEAPNPLPDRPPSKVEAPLLDRVANQFCEYLNNKCSNQEFDKMR